MLLGEIGNHTPERDNWNGMDFTMQFPKSVSILYTMILFKDASNSIYGILLITSGFSLHNGFFLHLDRVDSESTHSVALHAESTLLTNFRG